MSKTIFTQDKLLKAYYNCRQTKRNTINAIKFEMNLEENLQVLLDNLKARQYRPGKSICFVVTIPKPREIFAATFGDRIIHHLLINEVQKIWEKNIFIDDSYACRKGKGNHYGVSCVFKNVQKYAYYGQFDISNFFCSIDKTVTFEIFAKVIDSAIRPLWWKNDVLWLAKTIIFHNPASNYYFKGDPKLKLLIPPQKSLIGKSDLSGLPIGNLTSQFLANVYLNELDQFVTRTLGCTGYGRYVDDFLVFSNSKEEIIKWRTRIDKFLKNELKLTLHPKKQQIQPSRHGVPFVGYFIKPWGISVRRNVTKTLKNKIYLWNKDNTDVNSIIPSINSYFGHLGKAKTARLRSHLIKEHFSLEIKNKIVIVGNFHHLKTISKTDTNYRE